VPWLAIPVRFNVSAPRDYCMVRISRTVQVVAKRSRNMPIAYRGISSEPSQCNTQSRLRLAHSCRRRCACPDRPLHSSTGRLIYDRLLHKSAPHLRACDDLPSARSCAAESNYPSLASKESTGITFVNRSAEPIKIYWLSFQGERRLYHFSAARSPPNTADFHRAQLARHESGGPVHWNIWRRSTIDRIFLERVSSRLWRSAVADRVKISLLVTPKQ